MWITETEVKFIRMICNVEIRTGENTQFWNAFTRERKKRGGKKAEKGKKNHTGKVVGHEHQLLDRTQAAP